jgi:hypothetical protein
MIPRQNSAKKHTEQRAPEDAGKGDQSNYQCAHALPPFLDLTIMRQTWQAPGD